MKIKSIDWLDIVNKEAILAVSCGKSEVLCFCCPCYLQVGDLFYEPLECVGTENVMVCDKTSVVEKDETVFGYKIQGELINCEQGLVSVLDCIFHINPTRIPKDLHSGMFIQFVTSRIDIW